MSLNPKILTPEMYLKAIEGSDSALWVFDIKQGICYLSNRYYLMLGYVPGEFEGTNENLYSLLHPDDVEKSNKHFAELFDGKTDFYRNEVRLKCKSGKYLPILTQGLVERNSANEVVMFIGWNIDISSLKEAQKKLDEERAINVSQSRLAQLGLLAGGLAHEVNNPLTVIQVRAEMLLKELSTDVALDKEKIQKGLEKIQESSKKIAEIIHGLKTIAYGGIEGNQQKISLIAIVEEVIEICRSQLSNKGIRLHLELGSLRPNVMANPSLLGQVFLNLVNNASDAVEAKKDKDIWIKILTMSDQVSFIIEDNGSGISKSNQEKIMLPFFTTKEPGKGTGLGLSISQSIIKSQGGKIHFQSKDGLTTFSVDLPIAN